MVDVANGVFGAGLIGLLLFPVKAVIFEVAATELAAVEVVDVDSGVRTNPLKLPIKLFVRSEAFDIFPPLVQLSLLFVVIFESFVAFVAAALAITGGLGAALRIGNFRSSEESKDCIVLFEKIELLPPPLLL